MKRIALILFLLFSLCVPVYAANFVEIARDDRYLIYIDADSIELRKTNNNEYIVAWIKWIYRGDSAKELSKEYKQKVDHKMSFLALNRDARQMQSLSDHLYDKKGNILEDGSWQFQSSEYSEVIPNSYGELIYDFIMFYYNKK